MPILPRSEKTPLGIYIHIPFCRSKCQYCDFYSLSETTETWLPIEVDSTPRVSI